MSFLYNNMKSAGSSQSAFSLDEFGVYLKEALKNALKLSTGPNGDYAVHASIQGVTVIPYYPVDRPIDYSFYTDIYKVLVVAAYPYYTVLKPLGLQLVAIKGDIYQRRRGLFFPWLRGVPKRKLLSPDQYSEDIFRAISSKNMEIPLMENFSINLEHTTHIAISGQSGSGKSYLVRYFLPYLLSMGDLTLIDPKADDLLLWAKSDQCTAIRKGTGRIPNVEYPDLLGKTGTFLSEVSDTLAQEVQIMYQREDVYSKTGKRPFGHRFIVIDELLALTQGRQKVDVNNFFANLSSLALLGRSAKMHLILISQRFSSDAMPTSIRDQLQAVFQLGPITKSSTQFLFPDFDSEGVIPPRGKGTGICQVQGDVIPYPRPFLSPTYTEEYRQETNHENFLF